MRDVDTVRDIIRDMASVREKAYGMTKVLKKILSIPDGKDFYADVDNIVSSVEALVAAVGASGNGEEIVKNAAFVKEIQKMTHASMEDSLELLRTWQEERYLALKIMDYVDQHRESERFRREYDE